MMECSWNIFSKKFWLRLKKDKDWVSCQKQFSGCCSFCLTSGQNIPKDSAIRLLTMYCPKENPNILWVRTDSHKGMNEVNLKWGALVGFSKLSKGDAWSFGKSKRKDQASWPASHVLRTCSTKYQFMEQKVLRQKPKFVLECAWPYLSLYICFCGFGHKQYARCSRTS